MYHPHVGLPQQLIQTFMAQIIDAMALLHSARIIHCDLKPVLQNVTE
jgi:serine/threonine protein kinase